MTGPPLFPCLPPLLVILAVAVSAQGDGSLGSFFDPPGYGDNDDSPADEVWEIGETKTIKFTTVYSSYKIELWQQSVSGEVDPGPAIFGTKYGAVTQFDWSVQTYNFNLDSSPVFFLWLWPIDRNTTDQNDAVASPNFNITAAAASSVSSSSVTPTSAPITTTTSVTTASATTASGSNGTRTPSPTPSAGSLSAGARIGIGVGVGLAVLVAVVAGLFLWRRWRRRSNRGHEEVSQAMAGWGGDEPEMAGGSYEGGPAGASVPG
ncbi:hypothetical protein GGR52DRAFT_8768 [Hypoxylon sp. FL1284]|nr:hypothetical protein GGR52DRAFT_8768 [Hypoxylon sp. FL1284]